MPGAIMVFKSMLIVLALSACTVSLPRSAVPADMLDLAVIPGLERARYWSDEAPDNLGEMIAKVHDQRVASGIGTRNTAIALSGGGDDGAFGSGLLVGWTARGDRPEFTTVTGVSTGALTAPFVFLGSDYDPQLKQMYGGFPPDRIFDLRTWVSILPEASVADSRPLANLIAHFVDDDLIAAVAREHRRGRRLLVQTTHLDAQRAMIWDMGEIANSGAPHARDVFRKALLASASIPGVFPPVIFQVEADGQTYDEMHVDGGMISEATVLSGWQSDMLEHHRKAETSPLSGHVYVVRNGHVAPEYKMVERNLFAIAGRGVSTLIKMQGIADLMAGYDAARNVKAKFHVAWIGEDFEATYPGPFDVGYMTALYNYGYDLMTKGEPWSEKPPQLMTRRERAVALRVPGG